MAHSHCPPTPWYLQARSAKMVDKEDTQADCAFSLSVVSPSSCWQTPLLLRTLAGPQQCCQRLQDVDTANSREALATSDRMKPVQLHTKLPKKKKMTRCMRYIHSYPHFWCMFHCMRIQHLPLKTVSVHIWHRSTCICGLQWNQRSQTLKTCTYGKELHAPRWNINSLVHLQQENT